MTIDTSGRTSLFSIMNSTVISNRSEHWMEQLSEVCKDFYKAMGASLSHGSGVFISKTGLYKIHSTFLMKCKWFSGYILSELR